MKIPFTRDVLNQIDIDLTVRCDECNKDLTHFVELDVDEVLHEERPTTVFVSMKTVWCSKCAEDSDQLEQKAQDLQDEVESLEMRNRDLEDDLESMEDERDKLSKELEEFKKGLGLG